MESTEFEYRAVIKFLLKEGCNATAIHQRSVAVYDDSAPDYCTVTRWFKEFKCGRQSVEDDFWSGRPSDAVNPILIAVAERLIMVYRKVKMLEIAEELQISAEC